MLSSPWTWAGIALLLRLAALLLGPGIGVEPYSDSVDYHRLASHLSQGRGFSLGPSEALYPSTFRPPLLPFVIAPFYALLGPHYIVALIVQIVLSALTVPLVHTLAREVRGPRVALWAAILVACWPPLVFFSTVLLTETLTALLAVIAVLLAVRLFARDDRGLAIGLGVALGLSALARPTALPLAAALFAWLLIAPRRPLPRRIVPVLLGALGLLFAITPWILRNHAVTGRWIGITTGGGAALYDSNNPIVLDDPAWRGGALSLRQIEPYASEFRGRDEVEIDRLSARRAREFLLAHRDRWVEMAAWKLARFYRPWSETPVTGGAARPGSPLGRALAAVDPLFLSWGLLLPFFVVSALRTLGRPRDPAIALALAVLVQTMLAVVYWGSLRMRAPVEPFLVILGAAGAVAAFDQLRRLVRRSG